MMGGRQAVAVAMRLQLLRAHLALQIELSAAAAALLFSQVLTSDQLPRAASRLSL